MANASDSGSETEEYFPTPLPTPAVTAALRGCPVQERQPVPEDTGSLHYSLLEGRACSRSLSPPHLLPVSPADLAADVEQVCLHA